jgi:hypothetical protein
MGLGLTVAAIGFGVAGCGDSIKDKIDEAKTTYSDAKTTYDNAKNTIDDATVKGGASNSFYQAANLSDALSQITDKAGDDAIEVTVYPGYVQADASTGSESSGKRYRVNSDKKLTEASLKLTGPGKLADNVFPFSDVNADTIDSTVAAVAKKAGKTLDDVKYVSLRVGIVSGKPEMNIYVSGGGYYTANLDGSDLKDVGGAATTAVNKAKDIANCVKNANGDVTKIQACAKK